MYCRDKELREEKARQKAEQAAKAAEEEAKKREQAKILPNGMRSFELYWMLCISFMACLLRLMVPMMLMVDQKVVFALC